MILRGKSHYCSQYYESMIKTINVDGKERNITNWLHRNKRNQPYPRLSFVRHTTNKRSLNSALGYCINMREIDEESAVRNELISILNGVVAFVSIDVHSVPENGR